MRETTTETRERVKNETTALLKHLPLQFSPQEWLICILLMSLGLTRRFLIGTPSAAEISSPPLSSKGRANPNSVSLASSAAAWGDNGGGGAILGPAAAAWGGSDGGGNGGGGAILGPAAAAWGGGGSGGGNGGGGTILGPARFEGLLVYLAREAGCWWCEVHKNGVSD